MSKVRICHECGTQMADETFKEYVVTKFDGSAVVCTEVPITRCPKCGEVLFSSEVAELFDRIRRGLVMPTDVVTIQLPRVRVEDLLTPA